jgi:Exopolysaccharide biosynthesis protein YbjH
MKRSLLALLFMLPTIVTAEQAVSTSFQGYSGLINTPTAELFDNGKFYFQYSNQTEFEGTYQDTANFHFGLGLWDYVEVSGRNAAHGESLNGSSDLSANIKLGIPYIPKEWFSLAIGIQDLGGSTDASLHDAQFIVASKDILENISISAGLGNSESSQGRLNGIFGSISWQTYDWAKISLEYDAADTNLGLHLSTPQDWFDNGTRVTANILAYSSSEQLRDEFYYGVGLSMPLDSPAKQSKQRTYSRSSHYSGQSHIDNTGSLEKVKKRLVKEGFESIKVGRADHNTAYIELENHIYNRNQLDGLGVALGYISTGLDKEYSNFVLVIKEREVPILEVTGSLADYREFLNDEQPLKIVISTDTFSSQKGVRLADNKNANDSWLKPRFTFWPSLVSAVGTEYGMYDVSVALISHLELPLWPGGAISAVHMTQLAETEDFKDGRYFGNWKQKTGLQEYSLHQTFALPYNIKNMTFAGRYRESYNFVANEIRWQNNDGSHRINLLTAKYENQELAERKPYQGCNILFPACWPPEEATQRDVMMGMYRYYSTKFDASAEIRVGQYWQQDKGVIFKLERMFGDVTINLSYKNTKIDDQEANQFIGLGFSIPLTPRKDHSNKYVQVRGIPKWNYTVETLVGLDDNNLNDLTPGTGDSARMFYNLDNFYYNLDRLGKAYIYNNASRLKQAFENIN